MRLTLFHENLEIEQDFGGGDAFLYTQKMENKNMDDDITANLIGRHQNANKDKGT